MRCLDSCLRGNDETSFASLNEHRVPDHSPVLKSKHTAKVKTWAVRSE
jgi:hypothetical protein